MNATNKLRLMMTITTVSLLLCGGLGFYAWHTERENEQLRASPYLGLLNYDNTPMTGSNRTWDPDAEFKAMQKQMDQAMRHMQKEFNSDQPFFDKFGIGLSGTQPEITMKETDKAYEVTVTVPEGQQVNVKTDVDGNTLSISGEVSSEDDRHSIFGNNSILGNSGTSKSVQRFSQTVTLASAVDQNKISTIQKGDKMIITLPKVS